jgi:hypothetical protein
MILLRGSREIILKKNNIKIMIKHFRTYYWKAGKPYGLDVVDPAQQNFSYKIIADPYYKRLSIEKFHYTQFEKTIYDSLLLDFRHLTLDDQVAWQREVVKEGENQSVCLLRNQDDRTILMETLFFENQLCRSCQTSSIHGVPLAVHRMYYQCLHDAFNGVVLYDLEEHPVMMKLYEIDPLTKEFTTLLKEEWNMQPPLPLLQGVLPYA